MIIGLLIWIIKSFIITEGVYSGCVKAVDFIHSLPQFNQEDLGVSGGSQGGALAIVMAALDQRVDYLVSYYPALCDLTGYLNGRAGDGLIYLIKRMANSTLRVTKLRHLSIMML